MKYYHFTPEWTWKWWQWRSSPHSPKPQHYWSLAIRLFSVIFRTLIAEGGLIPLQRWKKAGSYNIYLYIYREREESFFLGKIFLIILKKGTKHLLTQGASNLRASYSYINSKYSSLFMLTVFIMFNLGIYTYCKWWTPMDPHMWPSKSRMTSSNIHTEAMWGYGM